MDPNANLEEIRTLLAERQELDREGKELDPLDLCRLAELIESLDGWLSGGGFLPKAWARA